MKLFISADIEGVTGVTHWDETSKNEADYEEFREQMTDEVLAACKGALAAGAKEIWINDAHASGRNLIFSKLPHEVKLIRGWSGHPFSMMDRLDDSFQASVMIGYHSAASADTSPLAHTISGKAEFIKINDRIASEFLINTYTSNSVNVPVVYLSGDLGICNEAQSIVPGIGTCIAKEGIGNSTVSRHPHLVTEEIRTGVEKALSGDLSACRIQMPDNFQVRLKYKAHTVAHNASFYPGCKKVSGCEIEYNTNDFFDVLRLISFVV